MEFWKTKALAYVAGSWGYRWWALAIAWIVCLAGWTALGAIPDQYQVEAKVYLDTDSMMKPLLQGLTVTVDPSERIEFMLRTLVTRPNLEQIVRLTDSNAASFTPVAMQMKVEELEKRVSIRGLDARNYYAIGFTDNNSGYAQAVTQSLLTILVDSNIGDKRRDMEGAKSFIEQKLTEYETRLREAERRRANFRAANLDILGQAAAVNRVDAVSSEIDQARKDLKTAVAKRDTLRRELTTTPKSVAMNEGLLLSSMTGAGRSEGQSATPLDAAKRALMEMKLRYTEVHPDVIAQKRAISELEAHTVGARAISDASGEGTGVPNPLYVQLRTMLAQEEMNVSVERQRVASATAELSSARNLSAKAIAVLTKYGDLDRDYGNLENTYKELVKSRETANLSQAMDDRTEAITFRVIEAPQKSQVPAAPNRPLWNSVVLFMALATGATAALLLFMNSDRFLTSQDLSQALGVPIIGVVTRISTTQEIRRQRASIIALTASLTLLLVCYVGVIFVLRSSLYSLLGT